MIDNEDFMKCLNCSRDFDDSLVESGLLFCPFCGVGQPRGSQNPDIDNMTFCSCGQGIVGKVNYCPSCGQMLNPDAPPLERTGRLYKNTTRRESAEKFSPPVPPAPEDDEYENDEELESTAKPRNYREEDDITPAARPARQAYPYYDQYEERPRSRTSRRYAAEDDYYEDEEPRYRTPRRPAKAYREERSYRPNRRNDVMPLLVVLLIAAVAVLGYGVYLLIQNFTGS
ncbi:ABC transporter substrate-binding protein [Dehalococcoides mccartyi]